MRLSFAILALGISVSLHASCMSDFDCGIGYVCAKKPYSSNGVCMKSVDEHGVQKFDMPSMDSVGPNMSDGSCDFNTDCPIGFRCDPSYKICIKN